MFATIVYVNEILKYEAMEALMLSFPLLQCFAFIVLLIIKKCFLDFFVLLMLCFCSVK